ncbi:MAG: hypothetical protein J5753_04070 [Oscillospiraceae bacterium]|nr:hypothetical protein [Oscillospiraceae bacterium]
MRALLRAGLRRDLHSIYTYLALAVSFLCGLLPMWLMLNYNPMIRDTTFPVTVTLLIAGEAVSSALLLLRGALEHDSGMIRNRLIGGASKGEVLLSELILAAGISMIQGLITTGMTLFGALLRSWNMKESVAAKLLVVCLTGYLFFAVVMTVVWYYSPRASFAVIAGCVFFTVIGMGGAILADRLAEPEHYKVWVDQKYDEEGRLINHRELINDNPLALHGTLRKVCEAAQVMNPLQTPPKLCDYLETQLEPGGSPEIHAEKRKMERSLLRYRPAALFGLTLLVFAGGILFAPKKNFN